MNEINLLKIEDIQKITGWSRTKIIEVMNREDFPVIKVGKENQVLDESFKDWLRTKKDLRR